MLGLTELYMYGNRLRGKVPTELAVLSANFKLFNDLFEAETGSKRSNSPCQIVYNDPFSISNHFDPPFDERVLAAGCNVRISATIIFAIVTALLVLLACAGVLFLFRTPLAVLAKHRLRRPSEASSVGVTLAKDSAQQVRGAGSASPLVTLLAPGVVKPFAVTDVTASEGKGKAPKAALYTANKAVEPNVVLTMEGALASLDALDAGKSDAEAARAAQRLSLPLADGKADGGHAPFVMISYVSSLKREPVGRAHLKAVLDLAKAAGYARAASNVCTSRACARPQPCRSPPTCESSLLRARSLHLLFQLPVRLVGLGDH